MHMDGSEVKIKAQAQDTGRALKRMAAKKSGISSGSQHWHFNSLDAGSEGGSLDGMLSTTATAEEYGLQHGGNIAVIIVSKKKEREAEQMETMLQALLAMEIANCEMPSNVGNPCREKCSLCGCVGSQEQMNLACMKQKLQEGKYYDYGTGRYGSCLCTCM